MHIIFYKAHELTRMSSKKFSLKNGRIIWTSAYMNGDRKRVCISRKSKGKVYKSYIPPHTEVIII